jgi:hypothetical protein
VSSSGIAWSGLTCTGLVWSRPVCSVRCRMVWSYPVRFLLGSFCPVRCASVLASLVLSVRSWSGLLQCGLVYGILVWYVLVRSLQVLPYLVRGAVRYWHVSSILVWSGTSQGLMLTIPLCDHCSKTHPLHNYNNKRLTHTYNDVLYAFNVRVLSQYAFYVETFVLGASVPTIPYMGSCYNRPLHGNYCICEHCKIDFYHKN